MIPLPKKTSENAEVVRNDSRMRSEAITEYKNLQTASGVSLVETNIITGEYFNFVNFIVIFLIREIAELLFYHCIVN